MAKNTLIDQTDYPRSDPNNQNYTENICEYGGVKHFFVDYWYDAGLRAYRYHPDERSLQVQSLADKFTAMMWKSSKNIGVAIGKKKNSKPKNRMIVVVRFSPPGNQEGEYLENVPICACHRASAAKSTISFWTIATLSLFSLFK